MESFQIVTSLSETEEEVLVIPDDCKDKSVFHLVKNGEEFCRLVYTDRESWKLIGEINLSPADFEVLTQKIEQHIDNPLN